MIALDDDLMSDSAKRRARDAGIDGALVELRRAATWQCETIRRPTGDDRAVALAIEHAVGVLGSVRGAP